MFCLFLLCWRMSFQMCWNLQWMYSFRTFLVIPVWETNVIFKQSVATVWTWRGFFFFLVCCQECGLEFSIIAATWTHPWKDSSTAHSQIFMSSQKHLSFIPFTWLCFRSSFWPCLQLAGSLNGALAQRKKKERIFENVPPTADVRGSDMLEWNWARECSRRE